MIYFKNLIYASPTSLYLDIRLTEYMNKFEVVLIYNPELNNSILKSEVEKFKSMLTSQSGLIINQENWGIRVYLTPLINLKLITYLCR